MLSMRQLQPHFENLKSLSIGRNSWTCRCTFLRELTTFVADNSMIIEDSQDIYCIDGVVKHELDLNSTSDCSGFYEGRSVLPELTINEHIPLLVAAFLFILIFITFIMAVVFRESLRVWLFAKCGVRICENPCEDYEKLYDAVLLYSEKDYELVTREIAAELEIGPPPLRLCLQHRDLSHDATYLQILESARASKRVVVLLSRNFIQTEWSRYEVRNAVHESLKDRPQKLVILEENDAMLEAENDLEMLPYIRSRVVNVIKLSDKHFWEKLRYALPAELQQTCNNYTLHHHDRLPKTSNNEAICMQHVPPPYYQENDDANYSSATTATPSLRQSRRSGCNSSGVAMTSSANPTADQQHLSQNHHRPPSEHIYFSIESDYNSGTGEAPTPNVHRPQSWRIHSHNNKNNSAQSPYMV